jgi:hypothetical protein
VRHPQSSVPPLLLLLIIHLILVGDIADLKVHKHDEFFKNTLLQKPNPYGLNRLLNISSYAQCVIKSVPRMLSMRMLPIVFGNYSIIPN